MRAEEPSGSSAPFFWGRWPKKTKKIKKLLTKAKTHAIIVNCIIIAYYARFYGKRAFVSIFIIIYRSFSATEKAAVSPLAERF